MRLARLASAALACVLICTPSGGFAQPSDPVRLNGERLRDRFMAAVAACGVAPAFRPQVVVDNPPGIVAYLPADRSIHLSRWADAPAPLTGMLGAWAARGTLQLDGEAQFAEIFNSLLVAHELGHYLQHTSGRLERLDNWEAEVEANRVAIAFWMLQADDAARLPARIENFTRFLGELRNPVPPGVEPRAYFNANYAAMGADPEAYGWFQGAFMRAAWADRANYSFCSLARLAPPA